MAATIPTNGIVLSSGLNVSDGDITMASGHGINFAADANATNMSAELFDDYEEGTWTGVYKSSDGVMTMSGSNTTGRYVKIGRFVHVSGYFVATANNNANTSQILQLSGLPFTVAPNNTSYTTQAVAYYVSTSLTSGAVIGHYAAVNDSVLIFQEMGIDTGNAQNMTVANLTADGQMMVSASYYTTS